MFDFSLLILQMFFSDIEESLYGILLVMIYTFVLDKVLVIGTHQARADIVSSHYEEIRQAIFTRLLAGAGLEPVGPMQCLHGGSKPLVSVEIERADCGKDPELIRGSGSFYGFWCW